MNENKGKFIDWRLNLWGESIDGSNQPLHPLPDDHEDDHETVSAPVATTSVEISAPHTGPIAVPTDHIHRPVNAKPGSTGTDNGEPATVPTPTNDASTPTDEPSTATPSPIPSDTFLPSFFPTFGVSKRTQIWIYGSLALILCFCAGLGIYFLVQRRKRLRNIPRDDYEFEALETEDQNAAMNGNAARRKGEPMAGALYDAFRGGSDEELFSSDEDEDPYHDTPVEPAPEQDSGSGEAAR